MTVKGLDLLCHVDRTPDAAERHLRIVRPRARTNLALLSTGVLEFNQNGIGISGREGSFNVNGLRNTANNFQLDGIDNNAYGTSNQGFSNQVIQVSPDAVAEFKVQTKARAR